MLEFLQSGKALSVLAVIGLAGLISKLITRNLYRRLLKETENMSMTRNKNLKTLKQKLENTYRVNQNMVNSKGCLEKLMYEFRFLHLPLYVWDNISRQMVLLGLLAGGIGSYCAYRYRMDSDYIVMYASAAAMTGLFLLLVDSSVNIAQKKQQLETVLQEYAENSVFVRISRETAGRERRQTAGDREREIRLEEERRQLIRENEIKDGLSVSAEKRPHRGSVRPFRSRNAKAEELLRAVREIGQESSGETGGTYEGEEAGDAVRKESIPSGRSPARREIDALKQSMEQIAVSREDASQLTEEEMKLLGELMRQYFAGNK